MQVGWRDSKFIYIKGWDVINFLELKKCSFCYFYFLSFIDL